tara:strand:- start:2347 stop:2520 length:174 start_codon:yes stop_codon:yes gene_type:complete
MEIIANAQPMTRADAVSKCLTDVLLYKIRVCEYCNDVFDIGLKGIFYWCGCERNESD